MISFASFRFLGAASAVAAGYPMGISTAGSKFCGKLSTLRHTVGSKLHTQQVPRDCREMLKIVFDFPNELIDKVIEIS